MSKSRQQKVKNGKRRIERRLRRKNWSQQDEPMFKANNIHYELSERTRGIGVGGIGAVHKLALASGLVEAIDEKVDVLKVHLPYHESDHVASRLGVPSRGQKRNIRSRSRTARSRSRKFERYRS